MAKLVALVHALEQVLDRSSYDGGGVAGLRSARDLVRVAVNDPEFVCECIQHELQLLRAKGDGSSLVPFKRLSPLRAGLAFGYWPPFGATGPHEHTAWTITAVVRNRLDVWVYDWAQSYDRGTLVEAQIVNASAPDVGFISSPTIHDVRNSTASWSVALHLLSDHDGRRPEGHPETLFGRVTETAGDDPYGQVCAARLRRAKVMQMAELLRASLPDPRPRSGMFEPFMVGATAARISALLGLGKAMALPLTRLRKVHSDLHLDVERFGSQSRLCAYRGRRAHAQLDVTEEFAAALSFIADRAEFDVASLPGDLTDGERQSLARAIEDSCLFEAVH